MKRLYILLLIFFISLSFSCITTPNIPDDIRYNYHSEGFLDRNHFQILAKGTPDRNSKTLVSKRSSALKNAKKNVNKRYINLLRDYYLRHKIPNYSPGALLKLPDVFQLQKDLKRNLSEFIAYGKKVCVYYNEDASAVIVHRISQKNIKSKILNIDVDFIQKKERRKK